MPEVEEELLRNGIITRPRNFSYEYLPEERWMKREEAIAWIRVWIEMSSPRFNLQYPTSFRGGTSVTSGVERIYLNAMAEELADRIRHGKRDAVTEVAEYNLEMDDVWRHCDRQHFVTFRFVGFMERASKELLSFLKQKEKEMNQK